MIEGKCPKCGRKYFGWLLVQPRNQWCRICGVSLLISEDGINFAEGYSPFSAQEYRLNEHKETTSEPANADNKT